MKIFWFLAESSNHLLVYGFIIQKFGLSSAEQFFWWPFLDSLTSHQPLTTSHLCMSIGWCCQLRWQLVTFSNSLAWAYSYSCCSRTPRSSKGEQTSVSKEFSILYWYHICHSFSLLPKQVTVAGQATVHRQSTQDGSRKVWTNWELSLPEPMTANFLILQMSKLRPREVKRLAHAHISSQCLILYLTQNLLISSCNHKLFFKKRLMPFSSSIVNKQSWSTQRWHSIVANNMDLHFRTHV